MVLYGSYTRDDTDEGSDVDLLLILEGEVDPACEILQAEDVKGPLALESGYAVSLLPVGLEVYSLSKEPFWSTGRSSFPAVADPTMSA